MIIALDGPAGSGKSSISKKLAEILNISYLDTGAMYRMVTLYFLQQNLEIEKMSTQKIKSVLENINLDITNNEFYLNGENVTEKIRDNKINNSISKIAANRSVREKLVEIQQKIAKTKSTILDGRDIGTVVFPNAEYKFFLTATPEIRAQRRVKQNKELKIEETYEDILESIKKRDYLDMNREESPLKKAKDAIEIDTSDLTFDEVVAIILQRIKNET